VVPKAPLPGQPERWRDISDHSDPYDEIEGVSPVNDDIDPADFPCRWYTFAEVAAFFRTYGKDPQVHFFGLDFESGFEHLDIHPSVRHRLLFHHDGSVWVKNAATFGLRSTPGEFGVAVETLIAFVEQHFEGRVKVIHHVDDLSVAVLDPSISIEDVVKFIEGFGWQINPDKTEPLSRQPVHVGCVWDVDALLVWIKEEKRAKYLAFVVELIRRGTVEPLKLREVNSLIGYLQYCAFVRRSLRHLLAPLYRFRCGYSERPYASRHLRHNEVTVLKKWRDILSAGPISSSFADVPPPVKGMVASDASNIGIGGYFAFEDEDLLPNPAFFSIPLLEGWQSLNRIELGTEAIISNAEAWGVEAAIEVVLKLGVRSRTVIIKFDNTTFVDGWKKGWSRSTRNNAAIARLWILLDKTEYDLPSLSFPLVLEANFPFSPFTLSLLSLPASYTASP
jgi:hypothetical protein